MIIVDILEEHLEETDFLWNQRSNALNDPNFTLGRLGELEERLFAHLDGLILGGQEAWKLLEPKLTDGNQSEAFAAASVALESEDDGVAALVCDRLGTASTSVRAGIQDAFCHASNVRVEPVLRKLLQSDRPSEKSSAIDSFSFRRAALDHQELKVYLKDNSIEVVRAALLAIARLRVTQLENDIMPLLRSDNMPLRQEAIRTGLVVGMESALDEARQTIRTSPKQADEMLILLGNDGHSKDLPLMIDVVREPALARDAITALGLLGYSDAMTCLLETVGNPKLARLGGEAIQLITGVNLENEGLTRVESGFQRQDDDADLEDDPDEDLPWPDLQALSAWWHTHKPDFDTRARYRYGKQYSTAVLLDSLESTSLPHRHHAAFELALSRRTLPYIETYARSSVQLRQMARLNGI